MTVNQAPLPSHAPAQGMIELRGVRVHNLKNFDLDIPLNKFVVVSGVSGSGKSSLAFDTLFREGQRRYVASFSTAARRQLEQIERPDADRIANVPVAVAIRSDRTRRSRVDTRSTVSSIAELLDGLRVLFARLGQIVCPNCHLPVSASTAKDVTTQIFSLPEGTRCQIGFVPNISDRNSSSVIWLARGFSRALWDNTTHELSTKPKWPLKGEASIVVDRVIVGRATSDRVVESVEVAFREGEGRCWLLCDSSHEDKGEIVTIDDKVWQRHQFSRRLECLNCHRQFLPLEPRLFSPFLAGACPHCKGSGQVPADGNRLVTCNECQGTRLREEARAVRIGGTSLAELCQRSISDVLTFIQSLENSLTAVQLDQTTTVRANLSARFQATVELGLAYLTLDRAALSLSGGELRRLLLAAVIGSRLTGTLVVVDEPSTGLTASELPALVTALRRVVAQRNSLIVVDHDPDLIRAAEHVIELGPAAGPGGGEIVLQGVPSEVLKTEATMSQTVIKTTRSKSVRSSPATPTITLKNVRFRDLQLESVEFPRGKLSVIVGPGGSGKTTLLTQILFPASCHALGLPCDFSLPDNMSIEGGTGLVDVTLVDQSPLTSSSRSNPATWLEVFDEIRQTFAATFDARQRGFGPQSFSFNSLNGGRCRSCLGTGLLRHDMRFLPDVTLVCPECHGTRYRPEILEVKYRGRSIADILAMTAAEAASFFRSQQRLQARFRMLEQIGLDYLVLGQPSETLSGGEAQRLKLASRLVTPNQESTLILCDEPAAGLHAKDVHRLVSCFRELIANGHSVVVADNSLELQAAADHVISLD